MTELSLPDALAGHELLVVDVEGNGQQPPEIIELALLLLSADRAAGEADMRAWLVRPKRPITSFVTAKVHGISNADVARSPSWDQVAEEITAHLQGRVVVAHNAAVERRVLADHLPGWAPPMVLDTLRLAKAVWPGLPGGYGLDNLISHFGLTQASAALPNGAGRRHRAGHDTWMTAALVITLLTTLDHRGDLTWSRLTTVAATPDPIPRRTDRSAGMVQEDGLW